MNGQISEQLLDEIRSALINDPEFQFKRKGDELQEGICPNCGEPECYIKLSQPFRVSCHRLNNCAWSQSTRELYPDIFENLSRRHPATDGNPNATADAYMTEIRGFDPEKIRGMYFQANAKHKTKDEYYPAVKVIVSQTCYWLRIINADDVRRNGAKSKIIGDYKDFGWIPPGMTFEKNDEIWIVEGIFKAMAFLHIGRKAISSLSCGNLPRQIIREHKNKGITWILAEDADNAGQTAAAKYAVELRKEGTRFKIAFPVHAGEDWDDVFRDGRLNDQYINDSFFRGHYFLADHPMAKAFYYFCKNRAQHHIFEHENSLYRYKVDEKKFDDETKFEYPLNGNWDMNPDYIGRCMAKFANVAELKEICPCRPQFLYIEQDILTKERTNTFYVEFANHTPSMLMSADGTIYKNSDNFSNALLRETGFAPFNGNSADLQILHKMWFRNSIKFVKSVPFLGYEADSKIYVFPDFAYSGGQFQKTNQYGYITFGRTSLKCNLAGLNLAKTTDEFTGAWLPDFYRAFSANGMVLLSWWLGTLFAEQIRKKQSSWPFLEYTGAPGAGKSTQIKFMWRTMGIDNYEGFDPNKTSPAGRARQMTQIANLPVVLLEGDRNDGSGRQNTKMFDFSELKPLFNFGASVRTLGVKNGGNETQQLIFRGAVLISQNAEVRGEDALLSRIVHCHCTQDHFTPENGRIADRLKQMSTRELGGFLHAVLRKEKELLAMYYRIYSETLADFNARNRESRVKEIRLRESHAQVAAWTKCLELLFGKYVTDEMISATVDHLWNCAQERQTRLQSDHPYLEQFWEVFHYLRYGKVEGGVQVDILNHSSDPALIAINLPHFMEVAAAHRQQLPPQTELTGLFKICKKHKCKGLKGIRSKVFGKITKCWIFEKGDENSQL